MIETVFRIKSRTDILIHNGVFNLIICNFVNEINREMLIISVNKNGKKGPFIYK